MWKTAALAMLLALAGIAAAQNISKIEGEVIDVNGKPFPDVFVTIKNDDTGMSLETKTDAKGRFYQAGLRAGIHTLTFKMKNPQGQMQQIFEQKVRLTTGGEERVVVNFKELLAKEDAATKEARKKQEEESKKFEGMKGHFDAARAALDQAKALKAEADRAPADQRAGIEEQMAPLLETAITEFKAAEAAAPDNDPNLAIVVYNLGEAYDAAKKYAEAAEAYQKAVVLKPTEAGYFNNLGNVLAKIGKIQEAGEAYAKSAQLDPPNAAQAWRNFGIVLYSNNRLKDAVEPLRKATVIDPNHPDAWYLLGASLLATMESKKEGDKLVFVVQPGTAEAYQKYLDIAPNGRFANDSRAALTALESMGAGVQTKIRSGKKKG